MQHRWRLDPQHRPGPIAWLVVAVAIAILISLVAAKDAHGAYVPVTQWGDDPPLGGEFESISEAATDPAGNVYLTDSGTNLVQKFDSSGNFLTSWGGFGFTPGKFNSPSGVAVDPASGSVFVLESTGGRVQKFDANGTFLTTWGSFGAGDGQLSNASALAVDQSGNVFVVDAGNKRVQKFSSSGSFLGKWGVFGSGDGEFREPVGIAIDSTGVVYVNDVTLGRVQKFDGNGTFLGKWNASGRHMDISADGVVYTVTLASVRRQDLNGAFLGESGGFGSGDGEFNGAAGIAVGAGGAVYVGDAILDRVQKFDSTGGFLSKWGIRYRSRDGQLRFPEHVAIGPNDGVYVADRGNSRVQKFGPNGAFISKWGTPGTGDGEFTGVFGIAIDAAGNVYTTEIGNGIAGSPQRVQKFDSSGNFLTKWGTPGAGPGQFDTPSGIAVSPANGDVYVVDRFNNRIQRFAPDGTFVSAWGSFGAADGMFRSPLGIAIDSDGQVYVADHSNARVQKFDANGNFISRWDVAAPSGIAVDNSGHVLVTTLFGPPQVMIHTTSGTLVTQFGSEGAGVGQFRQPEGIAVHPEGDIYVSDSGNNRIQEFRDNAGFPRPKAATPIHAPLVPAYDSCLTPNRRHASPLAFDSCSPAAPMSAFATAGTLDANGAAANMVGSVRLRTLVGSPTTPADEADVEVVASVDDVRNPTTLTDYTGELGLLLPLRITDRWNGNSFDRAATVTDLLLRVSAGCGATADPAIGSTCATTATLDALVPGTVPEGKRSNWQLGPISLSDGGPDGDAGTLQGNTPFAVQGVFVP
jgi:DNA-binding beta-propeller fold protein YncE